VALNEIFASGAVCHLKVKATALTKQSGMLSEKFQFLPLNQHLVTLTVPMNSAKNLPLVAFLFIFRDGRDFNYLWAGGELPYVCGNLGQFLGLMCV